MKNTLFFLIASFCLISHSYAQTSKTITGLILDKENNAPVEFATIAIVDQATNTPITGTNTDLDGKFILKTTAQNFYIEISFIGYESLKVSDFEASDAKLDLGTIYLSQDSQQLDEIVVEGQKSTTEFRLDKRVFNVGADLSSAGASAIEVLNNVPSVNVNIEGQISLRGSSGVQILINGKPSVLASEESNALGTITADMIESIEVITNPSAKYEAEGTSGIINIILKKEERKGTNGSISINTGVPHNHSVGFSLNHRSEKFNLFTQMGVGYKDMPNNTTNINTNYLTDSVITAHTDEHKYEEYYNVTLGTDYHINDNNVITVSGNYALELENQPSTTNYTLEDNPENTIYEWTREENTDATNPKYQFEAQYKRDFEDHEDHDLMFSAIGSYFGKDQSSLFNNSSISGEESLNTQQQTATDFSESKYTFKLDYARPLNEEFSIETGAQYLINDVSNDYQVQNLENNTWTIDETQTNLFEYNQNVLGIYGTGSYEGDLWGIKLGARIENTDLNTLLVTNDSDNHQQYTNFFPTIHSSYKLSNELSLQAGYSRRIYRPRLWDLNPFFNIRNNYSIRQGNPDLLPQYTDSYEVSSVYNSGNLSLSTSLYHRYTTQVIESITTYSNNVSITKPENIGTNHATGLEISTKYDPTNWMTLSGDFNYNYYLRKGALEGVSIDYDAEQWTTKLNGKFKLPADIDIEITGRYRSSYETVQGNVKDQLYADAGVRKKILHGKGVINMSIRDIFASRIEKSNVLQEDYSVYNRSLRGRFLTIGFSYGFGKGEAMAYGGKSFR